MMVHSLLATAGWRHMACISNGTVFGKLKICSAPNSMIFYQSMYYVGVEPIKKDENVSSYILSTLLLFLVFIINNRRRQNVPM